jgi:hypothetical protein
MGWKRKIDDACARKKSEVKASPKKWLVEYSPKEAESQGSFRQQLTEHKRMYTCHVCGKPSDGPQYYPTSPRKRASPVPKTGYSTTYDFDSPTGLELCSRCYEFTCFSHLNKGICQTCSS